LKNWKDFYESPASLVGSQESLKEGLTTHDSRLTTLKDAELTQVLNTYILVPYNNNFLLIHQQAAHERVLYDQMNAASKEKPMAAQRSMFPVTLELPAADAAVMEEIISDLHYLGYLVEPFGKNSL
jgi:DNA mismatch repair protein MutL